MASVDVIRDLIGGGLVAYNRPVATRFGVNAAVLLHELAYWCQRSDDGWCYRTQNEIQESTGMSAEVQHTARKVLKAAGVIEERREGIPARLYYCIDYDALVVALDTSEGQNQESSNPDTVVVKPGNSNRETANHTYKASNNKQVDEQTSVQDGGTHPFELLQALADVTGADLNAMNGSVKAKQCAVGVRLMKSGFTPDDVRRITEWLRSQSWRTGGIDLFTIEKERGGWELNGKPSTQLRQSESDRRRGVPA